MTKSPSATVSEETYEESDARKKERMEAHQLRRTLEKIDQKDDEQRIHNAAKSEAADLVWKHRNPCLAEVEKTAAYRNPDLDQLKQGEFAHAMKPTRIVVAAMPDSRSASGDPVAPTNSKRQRLPWLRGGQKTETPTSLPQMNRAGPARETILQRGMRKVSGKRQVSSGSSKGVFRNPEDEIYEEPEESKSVVEPPPKQGLPLRSCQTNSIPRGTRPLPEKSFTDPLLSSARLNRTEMHKSDPSQTQNAGYIITRALPKTPIKEPEVELDDSPRYKDGIEIRSDDIRAATSMRKSDRSPNLPTPTAVSDRLGRPIVSFDPKWKPGSDSPRNSQDMERPRARKEDGSRSYPIQPEPDVPEITIMEDPRSPALQRETGVTPAVYVQPPPLIVEPSVDVPDTTAQRPAQMSIPQINLPEEDSPQSTIPAITIEPETLPSRPLPTINIPKSSSSSRPLPPMHTQSSPSKLPASRPTKSEVASRVPWLSRTPTSVTGLGVTCTACSLPISGRIVTASGSVAKDQRARFHPECFTCYHCSTGLECVSFYPEPENARLERYQAAFPQLDPADKEIQVHVKGNEDLRFFCHLDYHELFSPRCHNCRTPIEGAVVLALGRHYHQDHFFCAECGDPFSSESPFVEHNNYPYCVSCHTKRTSSRCRSCRQPILNEMTIEALGGKWHDACFVCCDCGGDFGDEGRFFVREFEVELTEKEKRKGFGPKIEERAACQACEERRVKNVNIFL